MNPHVGCRLGALPFPDRPARLAVVAPIWGAGQPPLWGQLNFFSGWAGGPDRGGTAARRGNGAQPNHRCHLGGLLCPKTRPGWVCPGPARKKRAPGQPFSGAWQASEFAQCEYFAAFVARGLAWLARGAGGAPLPPRWLTPHHLVDAARPARAWCSQGRSPLPPKLVLHSTHAKGCKRHTKNSQWAFLPPWWLTSTRA